MTGSCYVSDLFYYPVKSLKGINVDTAKLDSFGISNDRRFMLINDENKFVTQRTHPQISQLDVSLNLSVYNIIETVNIFTESTGVLSFGIELFDDLSAKQVKVVVWNDSVDAVVLRNKDTERLSEFLGLSVRLAYMPESSFRQIDRQYFSEDKRVSFADGYPLLLTSEASLKDLNGRLRSPVSMANFRPNIVISGGISAYAEDAWSRLMIGDVIFELVKPCSRCVVTTIDVHGKKSLDKEPLKTLSQYRKNDFGICFGQNLVHLSGGEIRRGDLVSFE